MSHPPGQIHSGQRVGKYAIEELLGRGGMAEVWAVRHAVLETRSALKILLHAAAVLQERLLREGRAQARLQHPNIVPVRDVLNVNGVPGLLMPLIEGPSLEAYLSAQPGQQGLPASGALYLMAGLVDGVCYAHHSGLVHRDLKPANVLLERRSGRLVPRIADFGLVKDAADMAGMTHSGVVMGTPAYAAPEQLQDASQASAPADVFSLGVIFYELLTGRMPFDTSSMHALIASHRAPIDMSGIPERLRPLLADMLRFAPGLRPTSEALRQRLAAEPQAGSALGGLTPAPAGSSLSRLTPSASSNLPSPRDRFVGREDELSRLEAALAGKARLLTVIGPGGVGKTRLSQEAGRRLLATAPGAWPGGVWFCDLASARDQPAVVAGIGQALRLKLGPDPIDAISKKLGQLGRCLLILDNLEQVTAPAAAVISRLFDNTEAVFLNTSRAPLRMRGEQEVRLAPLGAAAGAALFVERAKAVNPDFSPTPEEGDQIEELVQMLDGLPLAIELAAARSRLSSPSKLLRRLSKRFKLLAGSAPDRPERQQTLRATLQWSWELLSEIEQAALAQCSTFAGRFPLDAAEAVVDLSDHDDDPWIEDVLGELVDKSLLFSHPSRNQEPRLSMLVSVREFAAGRLAAPGPVEARHVAWFARPVAQPASADRADLVLACERATAQGNAAAASRCATNAALLFARRGPATEGLRLLEQVDARFGDANPHRAELCREMADALQLVGRSEDALARAQQACDVAEARGNPQELRRALSKLGSLQRHNDQLDAAEQTLQRALVAARAAGDEAIGGRIHQDIAGLHWARGNVDVALASLHEALRINRVHGTLQALASNLNNLGATYHRGGRDHEAQAAYEEGLGVARQIGDRRMEAHLLGNLAEIHWTRAEFETVEEYFTEALVAARTVGEKWLQATVLMGLGDLAVVNKDFDAAEAWYGQSMALGEALGNARHIGQLHQSLSDLYRKRGQFGAALAAIEKALATSHRLGDIFAESLEQMKHAHCLEGLQRPDDALTAARAALVHARTVGRPDLIALAQLSVARLLALHAPDAREEALALFEEARPVVAASELPEESSLRHALRDAAAALGVSL